MMGPKIQHRRHRVGIVFILAIIVAGVVLANNKIKPTPTNPSISSVPKTSQTASGSAAVALSKLAVKGRAPMTGYSREQFGGEWADEGTCSMRDKVLAAGMTDVTYVGNTCEVKTGTLDDPYTGKVIHFVRGPSTSTAVQIDHMVAIGDAWQTGAQQISMSTREQLYNDPLELLAVDGQANEDKGDGRRSNLAAAK